MPDSFLLFRAWHPYQVSCLRSQNGRGREAGVEFLNDGRATFDGFVTVGMVLLAFAALLFYFAWPLIRQRPSPGNDYRLPSYCR